MKLSCCCMERKVLNEPIAIVPVSGGMEGILQYLTMFGKSKFVDVGGKQGIAGAVRVYR